MLKKLNVRSKASSGNISQILLYCKFKYCKNEFAGQESSRVVESPAPRSGKVVQNRPRLVQNRLPRHGEPRNKTPSECQTAKIVTCGLSQCDTLGSTSGESCSMHQDRSLSWPFRLWQQQTASGRCAGATEEACVGCDRCFAH